MAVDQEPDSVVTAESKIDEIDGGGTCFMTVKIEKDVAPVRELPPEMYVEGWAANGGCSQFVKPSPDYMVNYREGGSVV